ncbi:hypothetical protein [Rhodococcus ruber]|uniref:hypothetical protein n=1 Tax=Rhodococcus ruber TaxID=1830 RepID=UPI001F22EBD4|nr:hypothetical protein [Rhodococcus ruber]MCF8783243.1 hypothetical protein [Rhodococcus ruber]
MAFNGPESIRNQPCTNELESTRPFTEREVAQLAIYLAFEDALKAADERLITREEAITYMQALAPEIMRGTEAA